MRHSVRDIVRNALSSTLSFWNGWQKAILALALFAAGVVNLAINLDAARLQDQFNMLLLYTFEPLVVFLTAQLVFNFASAPFRLERKAHDASLAKIQSLEERVESLTTELEEQSPIRVDPTTGATVIGKAGGPVTIMGGHFTSGLRIGG